MDRVMYKLHPEHQEYLIGSDGSVWSTHRGSLRPIRPHVAGRGYLVINAYSRGLRRKRYVHHLVLEAFVGSRGAGCECRHLDGCRTNNALSNLRWGRSCENAADRKLHGTQARGVRQGHAKLVDGDVVEIRRLFKAGEKQDALARKFGISRCNVSLICGGRSWRHLLENAK